MFPAKDIPIISHGSSAAGCRRGQRLAMAKDWSDQELEAESHLTRDWRHV
jgi:hypothetical protein